MPFIVTIIITNFYYVPYKFVNKEQFEDTKEVTIRSGIIEEWQTMQWSKKKEKVNKTYN